MSLFFTDSSSAVYEVRNKKEYFDDIQDVKLTKDMLDLAKHIVNSKTAPFEPEKFEDHYEAALIDLIKKKRAGQVIPPKARPAAGNVVNLMDALRANLGQEQGAKPSKKPKNATGQKEMLLPIDGKKPKEAAAKKTTKPQRRSAYARKPTARGKFQHPDLCIIARRRCAPIVCFRRARQFGLWGTDARLTVIRGHGVLTVPERHIFERTCS
jgi:hypothetical protein